MKRRPFLLIDAGNSRIKWAVAGPGKLRAAGEMPTSEATPLRIAALAKEWEGHVVLLACVVPKLVPLFRRAFAQRIEVVTGDPADLGMPFAYPNPAELGADRIAAAVAIHAEGKFPAIIVACGTATAFTVLDAKGRLSGGAIAPGLQAQLDALLGATAQLPATNLRQPRTALGKSTRDAIRSGVMLSFQGGVKEIIRQLSAALPGPKQPQLVITGGHARHLVGALDAPFTLRPLLVLEGLLIIASRRFPSTS